MPDVIMFLNSLEFCNAVVQVSGSHKVRSDQFVFIPALIGTGTQLIYFVIIYANSKR